MKTLKTYLLTTAIALATLTATQAQSLKIPAASPKQTIEQDFALSTIKVEYSRPSVKGRTVFGELVPYGKMWRTGANQSTKITFGDDVKVEGKDLKAGTYALYTVPGKDTWEVMFTKDLTLGGNVGDYKKEDEVLRINVKPTNLSQPFETFTIVINDIRQNAAVIELLWANTRVPINISADIDERIMKNIESSVVKDNRPYYQAANYYYENNKDLNKALEWINKAADNNPNAYWVLHSKAKIQMKLKDYKGAIATAEQSKAKAAEDKNDEFVKMNDQLIAEARSMAK